MRKAQRLSSDVRERWPTLRELIECYFHQDWVFRSQTIENVIAEMNEVEPIDRRKNGARDWWRANGEVAWKSDFDQVLADGFGVNQRFKNAEDARMFWNRIYDEMIVGIRKVDEGWKP